VPGSFRPSNLTAKTWSAAALFFFVFLLCARSASAQTAQFGQVNVGVITPAVPLTVTFTAFGTLASTSVVTQGATGLDFANAGGGSCTANTTYNIGQYCTVNVIFAPRLPGPRYGAAILTDGGGNILGTGYASGIGVGPQVTFLPGVETTVVPTVVWPEGVAVDSSGNVYVSSNTSSQVYKETPSGAGYTQSVVPTSGLLEPQGLAVDGSGAVYIADVAHFRVLKEAPTASGYAETIVATFPIVDGSAPVGVAVDGSDNVFIDISNGALYKETLTAGAYVQSTIPTGVSVSSGVALDGSGNVYVMANEDNGPIVKETPAGNSYVQSTIPISHKGVSTAVALDANGDIYFTFIDNGDNGQVFRLTPGPKGYTQTTLATSPINQPFSLAVDGSGNIYITDSGYGRIIKETYTAPPSLSFSETNVGSTSADSPQTVTVQNVGNASLQFPVRSTGNNPSIASNFSWNDSDTSSCPQVTSQSSSAALLAAGAVCDLPISFTPAIGGFISGGLTLTDNNLNASAPGYTAQSIPLTGTGNGTALSITWPTPVPITYGTALSKTQLNATASISGKFSYSPSSGTVLTAGSHTLSVTFTPKNSNYGVTTDSVTLLVNQATPTVSWSTPSPISYGTALSSTQLDASANVSGKFSYNPAAGTIPAQGTDQLSTTFTPTDTTDYTTAHATVNLTVNPAGSRFSLSASPSAISVSRGDSSTTTISVTVLSGSPGKVKLAASGLPGGVTASFSSNPTTSSSVLTLKATKKASIGKTAITITGTAGSINASTGVNLTVLAN
jgi:hypothetical protein